GPLLRLPGLTARTPDREPDDPGDREGDGVPDKVAVMAFRIVRGDDRRDAHREREACERPRTHRVQTEDEVDRQRIDVPDEVVRDEPAVDERARTEHDGRRERRSDREAPAGEQRGHDRERGENGEPGWALRPVLVMPVDRGAG